MSIKKTLSAKLCHGLLICMMLLPVVGISQKKNPSHPLEKAEVPFMFVDPDEAKTRKVNFENNSVSDRPSKGEVLDAIIKNANNRSIEHPRYYQFDTTFFNKLLNRFEIDNGNKEPLGFVVYFGAFNPTSAPGDLQNWALKNQVVLIFSDSTSTAGKKRYYISGSNGDTIQISEDLKTNWINNYIKTIIKGNPGLLSTIYKNRIDNYDKLDIKDRMGPNDTKSIYYEWCDFDSFINGERYYQNLLNKDPNYTDSFQVEFVSYPVTGLDNYNPHGLPSGYFMNRLHILFSFMHKGQTYRIERNHRAPNSKWNKKYIKKLMTDKKPIYGGDNGQLCPYNCNN